MKNQHLVRLGSAALVFGAVTSTIAGSLLVATIPASATAPSATPSSAVTKSWADAQAALGSGGSTTTPDPDAADFSKMSFTVSQTRELTDQGVTVSWTGAKPTSPSEYATDYVQVMQCWGDEAAGPSPEQCQWGAPSSTIAALTGVGAAKRDLVNGDDPLQDPTLTGPDANPDLLLDPPVENPFLRAYRVPFRSVDGTLSKSTTELSKQFDATTTNEVTAARTASDGTGQVTFETQSGLEAPQLGCGQDRVAAGRTTPRDCWLVIVPRGSHNLDGGTAGSTAAGRVTGSPLSASAWRNRVVFPLGFQSVAQACPIGNAEQRLVGSEPATEAVTAWQPALCGLGTTYGYSQIGDEEAQHQIVSTTGGASRLALVNTPLDPATTPDTTIRYAPVAQSAIVIGFSIDYRLYPDAPAKARNGLQAQDLTLDARLVAKLLTQSYQADVPGRGKGDPTVAANASSIVTDPEFLALNPTFVGSKSDTAPAGLMVALGDTNANARVWAWLRADPVAAAFLDGRPDEWGMRINPAYRPLSLATDTTIDSFPKADLTIAKGGDPDETGYGTLDMRPYMNDMHEGAYRTLKADPNQKDSWNPFGQPKGYTSLGAQVPGSRFLLSITDTASAARYALPTAKLVNAAGEAVASTTEAITKGIATMRPSTVPGVVVADPANRDAAAYPLAMLSYAAVNVCASSPAERSDYATFIRYASGAGQVPGEKQGELPAGYVPLSSSMRAAAGQVAAGLTDARTVAAACPKPPAASAPTEPTASGTDGAVPPPTDTTETVTDPVTDPGTSTDTLPDATVDPVADAAPPVSTNDVDEASGPTQRTHDQPLAATRLGLAAALGAGLPALGVGPFLIRRGRRLAMLAAAHV
ncbi:hypothetical protein [Curtobacterium flaccumfaciens]|uniref:hypothetical protein n=1 Tax=Curtobacterium flaccumfaciens TaxID=2035 RepID=UPI001601E256|nr:hypothetical protein [Curtobacterium flaccumfaciens]